MPLVINVCQDAAPWEDGYNFATGLLSIGEIYMTSVADMVANVIAHAGERKIDRLNIWDHGSVNSFQVGNDRVSTANYAKHEQNFRRLRGRFTEDGFIHLCHCWIGQNAPLLLRLARTVGVSVYAGTDVHRAGGWNDGDYVRADPDGTFENGVRRPSVPLRMPARDSAVLRMRRQTMMRIGY